MKRSSSRLYSRLPPARGDITAIGQIFANLIGNSLKYLQQGRPGRIEVGGQLDPKLSAWFGDMVVAHTPGGDTLL